MNAALEQRRAAAVKARAVSHARVRARTAARVEDLEDLHAAGVALEEAVSRVGWSVRAAYSALRRRSHPLARPLSRLVTQQRKKAA
jgi:HD superfamily phosphodiesterase